MQINGAQLANLYVSKPTGIEDKARAPVVIDGKSFEVEKGDQSPPVIARSVRQGAISFNDAQQSRFIRSFSARDELSSAGSQQVIKSLPLPQGVQQYLQVAQMPNENNQKLLDETV